MSYEEWASGLKQDSLERQKLALRIFGSACLFSPATSEPLLWPTPQAHDAMGARGKNNTFSDHHYKPHDLVTAIHWWPTPVANDDNKSVEAHMAMKARMKGGPRLKPTSLNVVVKMWPGFQAPTPPPPVAPEMWQTPATDSFRSRGGDRKNEMGLDQQARFWPTPMADDARATGGAKSREDGRQAMLHHAAKAHADKMWPTPRAGENGSDSGSMKRQGQGPNLGLKDMAKMWPTPRVCEGLRSSGSNRTEFYELWEKREASVLKAAAAASSPSSPQDSGKSTRGQKYSKSTKRLNPRFVTWLMNWPLGWPDAVRPVGSVSFGYWAMASSLRVQLMLLVYFSQKRSDSSSGRIESKKPKGTAKKKALPKETEPPQPSIWE